MDLPVGAESLHRQLITQISYRGERGLLKGAKTTATRTCLELGLLIGKMIGTGEVTQEWGMGAIMAIGVGNWNYFNPHPKLDCQTLAQWKPHPRCVAYYHPTYLDQVKYQLALHASRGPLTGQKLFEKLQLKDTRQRNHLERILKQAVRERVLRRGGTNRWGDGFFGYSYSLVDLEQVPRILHEATTDPHCSKCARRLKAN